MDTPIGKQARIFDQPVKIVGVVQSFHADDAYLVEYMNGERKQWPAKYVEI